MKDKKDGKSRASYSNGGCPLNLHGSPLATSTTEKEELTLRAYHHHQNYYQPSTMSVPYPPHASSSPSFQSPLDYHLAQPRDMYEMTANYSLKPSPFHSSTYYNNNNNENHLIGHPTKGAYHTSSVASNSYDSYYFETDSSSVPLVQPFL